MKTKTWLLDEDIIIANELKEMYDLGEKEGIMFKKAHFRRLNTASRRANNILGFLGARLEGLKQRFWSK